ncbi:MAG TPA: hypothetical protein DD670_03355 [Planctomycetaceae bacterium]|nr:hypothetical protein [Planctomycetaceae bacterium]
MKPLAIALLSGGLDSLLAVRVLQLQSVAIEAIHVQTPFVSSEESAARVADELGVPLTFRRVGEDYVEVLRNPRYGFGKAVNPCLDCHLYMTIMARDMMIERGACCVVSGEILGQRPMSQKRNDLDLLSSRSGLVGRLLRPLSAKLLEPTIPETERLIDRARLCDYAGRGRRPLIDLAETLGVRYVPAPSPGCALTEKTFAPKLRDLFHFNAKATLWDCELVRVGRHFRIDPIHKIVLGRSADDNAKLAELAARDEAVAATLLEPESFLGPNAILCGPVSEDMLQLAGVLMAAYTRQIDPECREVLVLVSRRNASELKRIDVSNMAAARQTHVPLAR